MRRITKLLLTILIVGTTMFSSIPTVSAKEAFNINNFKVDLVVNGDGTINVTETIDAEFFARRHGIYLNLATSYEMNWGDGVNMNYRFPITDIKVLSNHEYEIEHELDGVQIRLGSADTWANTYETYKVSYTIHTRDLRLDGFQMLYHNIISSHWDLEIQHVDFSITFKNPVDFTALTFYTPNGTYSTPGGPLNFTIDGNTIIGSYNDSITYGSGLTVRLELPNGYFTFPTATNNATFVSIGSAILVAICFIFFLRHGKDEALIPVVEFSAPEGMTSADIGYIIDGSPDNQDIASLILYWAKQGCLTIVDEDETLTLIKNSSLPSTAKIYEVRMFNALFSGRDKVTTDDLSEKFYKHIERAKVDVKKEFSKEGTHIYTSEGLQGLFTLISALPIAALVFVAGKFIFMDFFIGAIFAFVATVLIILAGAFSINVANRWYSMGNEKFGFFVVIGTLLVITGVAAAFVTHYAEISILYVVVTGLLTVILLIMTALMRKRTAYGNLALGRVVGLRDFIITAEKDRLEMLVKENPTLFYDILPYAYALSLTDIWNDQFEKLNIPECDWYQTNTGYSPYLMTRRLSRSMNTLSTTMSSPPAPSGGSGGYSSGGGGGYSGGGFGGSSGGSW